MDGGDLWTSKLSSSSFRKFQIHSDACMGGDLEAEEDYNHEFSCPFCAEEFDIVGLFRHMDEEHQIELKNAICPICTKRLGVDMVGHITMQHANILKIQRKRRLRRGAPNSMFNMLRKELREGNRQSFFGGSSFLPSSSNPDPDPLLSSFIYSSNPEEDFRKEEPHSSKASCSLSEAVLKNNIDSMKQPALSKKDQEEKARKCQFLQGLPLSMMMDDIL